MKQITINSVIIPSKKNLKTEYQNKFILNNQKTFFTFYILKFYVEIIIDFDFFLFHVSESLVKNSHGYLKLKNVVWHSHNFLLPYITVEEYFIICLTFIFNLYFLCFVVGSYC